MKSIKPLIGNKTVNLKTALPLKLPISIMIDPSNLCNYRCSFCPTGNKDLLKEFKRPKGTMDFDLFKKIINDIEKIALSDKLTIKSLLLYKDGEPLLNKKLPDMIEFAKKKNIFDNIAITTNGSLLTEDLSKKLINSGIDVVRFSMQSLSSEGFEKITKTKYKINEIKKNIKTFFKIKNELKKKVEVIVSYVDSENMSLEKKENYYSDYQTICDRVIVNPIMGWTRSEQYDWRLGKVRNIKRKEPKICPDPFSRLSINFDGSASICCVDWSHGTVVGDLKKESFYEIWNGKRLKEFRLLHINGKRDKIGPCKNCDYLKGKGDHDIIDDVKDKLLKIYQ